MRSTGWGLSYLCVWPVLFAFMLALCLGDGPYDLVVEWGFTIGMGCSALWTEE